MKKAFKIRNGEQLFVARPADPRAAIVGVREILTQVSNGLSKPEAERAFNVLLTSQPYTFVGYYSADGKSVLDAKGWAIGKVQPGDSYVGWEVVANYPNAIGALMSFHAPDADPEAT